jgi:TetR/AcrR family transcriptional repressor of nem operon
MPRASVKEQIVDAAVLSLHEKGFNGASVQDITDAARVPKGSFYNHFDSKEDLAVVVLERYWSRVLSSLAILREEGTSPVERLRRYFDYLAAVARKADFRLGCLIGNMSVEMSGQSPEVRERLALLFANWTRAIEVCVREAQADGSLRTDLDAHVVAAFLLNAWEGSMARTKVDRDMTALRTFERVVATVLAS